jgi:predicted DNA-binding transcriptional regulator AlpA
MHQSDPARSPVNRPNGAERAQPRLVLSIAEIVATTGFSKSHVYAEIRRGNLQTRTIGRRRIGTRDAVRAWLGVGGDAP